jgi:hypothetical protein
MINELSPLHSMAEKEKDHGNTQLYQEFYTPPLSVFLILGIVGWHYVDPLLVDDTIAALSLVYLVFQVIIAIRQNFGVSILRIGLNG